MIVIDSELFKKIDNYALSRIKEYDTFKAKTGLKTCDMCETAEPLIIITMGRDEYYASLENCEADSCHGCPFYDSELKLSCSSHEGEDIKGLLARLYGTNYQEHQAILKKRHQAWRETFKVGLK